MLAIPSPEGCRIFWCRMWDFFVEQSWYNIILISHAIILVLHFHIRLYFQFKLIGITDVSLYNSLAILLSFTYIIHKLFKFIFQLWLNLQFKLCRIHSLSFTTVFPIQINMHYWCFTGLVPKYIYYNQLRVMELISPSLITQFWTSPYHMHSRPCSVAISSAVVIFIIYNMVVSSC